MDSLDTRGKRLKAAREAAGLTQQQIADLFTPALTRNAVSNWEADKDSPDTERWETIARAVKRSVQYLHTGEEPVGAPRADDPVFLPQLITLFRELDDTRRHELIRYANLLHNEQHTHTSTANPYPASGNRVSDRDGERRQDERRRK